MPGALNEDRVPGALLAYGRGVRDVERFEDGAQGIGSGLKVQVKGVCHEVSRSRQHL